MSASHVGSDQHSNTPSIAVLDAIAARRSISRLVAPAPAGAELDALLAAAQAAPDHGRLRPWRFAVLTGEAKDDFGVVLAEAYRRRCAAAGLEPVEAVLAKERIKLGRAPLVVVAACVPLPGAVPEIEQVVAVGAAVQNLLLSATALGYGSMWRTGDPAYDPFVKAALGLSSEDHIVGFVYLGRVPAAGPEEPPIQAAGREEAASTTDRSAERRDQGRQPREEPSPLRRLARTRKRRVIQLRVVGDCPFEGRRQRRGAPA